MFGKFFEQLVKDTQNSAFLDMELIHIQKAESEVFYLPILQYQTNIIINRINI
ncbi:hypothetical protein FC80_GL000790 [Liquorilactobacillus cacaonum DSM 21116]|uniref:Uncharacterized protein n=1 Tax=Liquorilactobacillus cacaonum DSM 21116 TaxID=1423729 RepID=A0A0R2CGD7_9LACO|nr:hypothetical protein FC80_GL000790 [Liquorilactobacillus cacaonum DSM 21116]